MFFTDVPREKAEMAVRSNPFGVECKILSYPRTGSKRNGDGREFGGQKWRLCTARFWCAAWWARPTRLACSGAGGLVGLDFDGVGEVEGSGHEVADGDVLAVLDVAGEHVGLEPIEAPGIFDGDDGVGGGDDALQGEGAV